MAVLIRGSAWPMMGSVDESALEDQTHPGSRESVTEQKIDCTRMQMRDRGMGRKRETFTSNRCR